MKMLLLYTRRIIHFRVGFSSFSCKSNACFARNSFWNRSETAYWINNTIKFVPFLFLHDRRNSPLFQTWGENWRILRCYREESYVTSSAASYVTEDAWWLAVFVTNVCPDSTWLLKNQTKMATDDDLDEIRASSRSVFRRWMKATTQLPRGAMPQLYFLYTSLPKNVQRTL